MINLLIKNIDKNFYTLFNDDEKKEYNLFFEFYGKIKPKINDLITIDEKLIDINSKYFCQPFSFEFIEKNEILLKAIKQKFTEDYCFLKTNEKEFLFKRIYG